MENTDFRSFRNEKKKNMESNNDNNSDKIDKTIIHFKLKTDFTIDKFYSEDFVLSPFHGSSSNDDKKSRWSFDISNVCMDGSRYFIFVAVSHIIDDELRRTIDGKEKKRGTTGIYPIELLKNEQESYVFNTHTDTIYQIHKISGICRFAEISEKNKVFSNEYFVLKRFIVFNFDGIHSFSRNDSFKLDKTFNYPKCIRLELDSLDLSEVSVCMDILHSSICDKYFLVEQYKNNVQLLEGKTNLSIL
jgi:hypothetical protein